MHVNFLYKNGFFWYKDTFGIIIEYNIFSDIIKLLEEKNDFEN